MKKQGLIEISRHLIGQRKPIVAFLGLSALYGCGDSADYTLYTKGPSCNNSEGAQKCQVTYQKALGEAKRTAMQYQTKRDCNQDYGDICAESEGSWQPRMAGFITSQSDSEFALPFFTSTNPGSSHFGYAFLADGEILGKYRDADRAKVGLSEKYKQPLPASSLDPLNIPITETESRSGSGSGRSVVSDLATAYILSELIDETGDVLQERMRTKRYQECMQRGDKDCYKISSGTGRISSTSGTGYKKSKPKLSSRQVKTYKSSPKATTISKGGFGRTGSVRGGFGG